MSDRWRGILALLVNPDLRVALAEAILEADGGRVVTPARRSRAVSRLAEIGLVRDGPAGVRFDDAVVRGILDESAPARPTGPDRYLDATGRIARYPVRDADRHELLAWVAARAFRPGQVMDEPQVNERLASFADDVAGLRRRLVDAELLERTRSGAEYTLTLGAA